MSDSSEDEDLSKFREAVDTTFSQLIDETRNGTTKITKENDCKEKPLKSERYLEESGHYNDVKVPEEMQKRIGAKVSAIIEKNIVFVDVHQDRVKKNKTKGGVRLFKGSESYLSSDLPQDTSTEIHNEKSRHVDRKKRRVIDEENNFLEENDKIKAVAVSGDHILSKEEIKFYKSRRKEKLFRYKKNGNSKVLTAVE